MNKRHYEHTLPNIRGSLSNTYGETCHFQFQWPGCGLLVFRHFLNKELTDQHLEQLFSSGSTRLIKGFKGKKGVSFDAAIIFDESFNLKLSFPKSKGGKGK